MVLRRARNQSWERIPQFRRTLERSTHPTVAMGTTDWYYLPRSNVAMWDRCVKVHRPFGPELHF